MVNVSDFSQFAMAWDNATLCGTVSDMRSHAHSAFCFGTDASMTPLGVRAGSESRALWRLRLPARASSAVLNVAVVFTNTSVSDAVRAARAVVDAFPTAWADAKADAQARWDSVFDPLGKHFSGSLPLLTMGDAASQLGRVGDADGTLPTIAKAYYLSASNVLSIYHTNLPPPSPLHDGATCPSTTQGGTDAAAPTDSPKLEKQDATKQQSALTRYLPDGVAVKGSAFSGRNSYVTGAGLNSTTNFFYWETSFAPTMCAPPTLAPSCIPISLRPTTPSTCLQPSSLVMACAF